MSEYKKLGLVSIVLLVILKIVFYRESLLSILRIGGTLLYMGLPGYVVLSYWKNTFWENLFVGFFLSVGFVSVVSYYLGLFGLPIWTHWWIPLVVLGVGIYLRRYQHEPQES